MRILIPLSAAALPVILIVTWLSVATRNEASTNSSANAGKPRIPEDKKIWDYLRNHRKEMIRVTRNPYHVTRVGPLDCSRPNVFPHSPHGEHWIDVFTSPNAAPMMTTGKGVYPEGAMILKQKYLDAAGYNTEFYTGMRKRERGYNPELGDWEFFMLDSNGDTVIARGKIESCMDCHRKYEATDFVSRRYLMEKANY